MLSGEVAYLGSLRVDDAMSIGDMMVNEFLVLDIDQGTKISDGSEDEAETPKRSELDEEVGDEGG